MLQIEWHGCSSYCVRHQVYIDLDLDDALYLNFDVITDLDCDLDPDYDHYLDLELHPDVNRNINSKFEFDLS